MTDWIAEFDWSQLQQLVWLLAVLAALPLLGLAAWAKVYPARTALAGGAAACAVSVLPAFHIGLLPLVLLADGLLVAAALADLASLPRALQLTARRETGLIASLANPHPVRLVLTNNSSRGFGADIRDDVPVEFQAQPEQFAVRLPAGSRTTLNYNMNPSRRGAFVLQQLYVRVSSRWRFWKRHLQLPVDSRVNVYPDMQQLSKYALLARTDRLSMMGVRRTRRIGQDNEFERLRDYTRDDNHRHIDWRSTARRNKLTVKDFQSNQSQRVIFMVDCGRMMTNESEGLSLLDHALNAMLMMSYVALRQGDSVGLICFSDAVHTYVPPKGGMNQMNQLIHASFDRFPELVESRYDDAFLYLATRCKRRALVILLTNVIDEVNSHQIQQYLSSLVGKHLPIGVLMRDHQLFDVADAAELRGADVFRAGAAAEIISWRHQVLTDLQHNGVLALDVFPREATAGLVNQYLQVKARHLL